MSFIRSLSSGVTGLRNHQLMMDVIGNNIANINTVGYKGSRISFSESFSQMLRNATLPYGGTGGVNPMQVGLGMSASSIDTLFSQGNIETTGQSTDLAIQGDGLFIVKKEGHLLYTRNGAFTLDSNGMLVHPGSGSILQGKLADANGNIPEGTALEDIRIALDRKAPANATELVKLAGNLNAAADVGETINSSVTIFDSLGNRHTLTVTFEKTGNNTWNWEAEIAGVTVGGGGVGDTVEFGDDGTLEAVNGVAIPAGADVVLALNNWDPGNGADQNQQIDINLGQSGVFAGMTQSEGASNVSPREQDGYSSGILTDVNIDLSGRIQGTFSNGTIMTLGQIMLAEFNNPGGLIRTGNNLYDISGNSGAPSIISPGDESQSNSQIIARALEQSNIDLTEEFTRMIIAQRGFQSGARVITVSDEILNEVVNLKR